MSSFCSTKLTYLHRSFNQVMCVDEVSHSWWMCDIDFGRQMGVWLSLLLCWVWKDGRYTAIFIDGFNSMTLCVLAWFCCMGVLGASHRAQSQKMSLSCPSVWGGKSLKFLRKMKDSVSPGGVSHGAASLKISLGCSSVWGGKSIEIL